MTVTIDLVTLNDTFDEWRTRTNQLINVVNDIEANTNLVNFISNTSSITITPQTGRGGFVRINANVVNRANDTSTINIAAASAVNTVYNAVITLDGRANGATQNIINTGAAANDYSDIVGAAGNSYTRTLVTAANNWANTVAVVANNYAVVVGTAGNNYTRTVGDAGNNYTNTVGTAGNNYSNLIGIRSNSWANIVGTAANSYAVVVGTAGNNYTNTVGTAGNNYTNTVGAAGNNYTNTVGAAGNNYTNTVGTAGNNFTIAIGTVGNNYANLIGTRSNSWANLVGTAANSYAVVVGTAGNNYTNTVGAAGNNYTNTVGAAGNAYATLIGLSSNAWANLVGTAANSYALTLNQAAATYADQVGAGANTFASATIAGANLAWQNTLAGANASIGAGANNYANVIGTRSNSWANLVSLSANAWANSVALAANSYAVVVGAAGNNYTNTVGTAGNNYTNTVGTAGNNYTNTVGAAGNNYMIAVTTVGNNYANLIGTRSNSYATVIGLSSNAWTNTVAVVANNYAGVMANASNGLASTAQSRADSAHTRIDNLILSTGGDTAYLADSLSYANAMAISARYEANSARQAANAAFDVANNALPNTSGVSFSGNLIFPTGNVGIGAVASPTKSIDIYAEDTETFVGTGSISGNVLTITAVSFGSIANGSYITSEVYLGELGTYIVGYKTATGGTGTYYVSHPQEVASSTIRASIVNRNSIRIMKNDDTVYPGQIIGTIEFASNDTNVNGKETTRAFVAAQIEDTDTSAGLVFGTGFVGNSSATANSATEQLRINSKGAVSFNSAGYGVAGQILESRGSTASPLWRQDLAFDKANSANILAFQVAGAVTGLNTVATLANTSIGNIFTKANTANITADLAYGKANVANITADLAYGKANSANILAFQIGGAVSGLNTVATLANTTISNAFDKANSANILAFQIGGAVAGLNTVATLSNTTISNAFDKANSANILAFQIGGAVSGLNLVSSLQNTTTGLAFTTANNAYNKANSANLLAFASLPKTGGTITGDLVISGNLTISGNTTYSNTQTLLVGDNIFVLNADVPVSVAPTEDAGMIINRGSAANAEIIWNETTDLWTFNKGTGYLNIASNTDVELVGASVTAIASKANGALQNTVGITTAGIIFVPNSLYVRGPNTIIGFTEYANSAVITPNSANWATSIRIQSSQSTTSPDTISFYANNLQRMFMDGGGNVGIGTASPTGKLFVVSGADQTALCAYGPGASITIDYQGSSQNYYEANTHYFKAGNPTGAERMRIDSTGNVGIGTTSPLHKLDVRGTLRVRNESGGSNANIYVSDGTTSMAMGIWGSSTDAYIGTTSSDALYIRTSDTDRVRIGSTGGMTSYGSYEINVAAQNADFYLNSVGGTGRRYLLNSTTSGSFSIYDMTSANTRLAISSSGYTRLAVANGNTTHEFYSVSNNITNYASNYFNIRAPSSSAGIEMWADDTNVAINGKSGNFYIVNSSTSDPDIIFQIGPAYTEYMRIANNACVGIGTSSPTSNIHVIGTANITSSLVVGTLNVVPSILGSNSFASATIAGANLFFQNTIAGANSAVGGGANNFARATIAGANLFFQNTIAGANDAVGDGANAFTSATIAGANSAVGGGANNFARATIAGANLFFQNTIAGANVITDLAYDKANAASAQAANADFLTSGTVAVARGGTGVVSYAVGDLLYASGATTLAKLADVATGNSLLSGGVGVAPSWGKIGLTTHVTGTLALGNGGTGGTTKDTARVGLGITVSATAPASPAVNDIWVDIS